MAQEKGLGQVVHDLEGSVRWFMVQGWVNCSWFHGDQQFMSQVVSSSWSGGTAKLG